MVVTFDNYQKGDAAKIKMRDGDMLDGAMYEYERPAWTMIVNGEVQACMGLFYIDSGIYQLWAVVSDGARGCGLAMVKFAKQRLGEAFDKLGLHRIQTTVRADNQEYQRWICLFGFKKEGILRACTADKVDLIMYSKVVL